VQFVAFEAFTALEYAVEVFHSAVTFLRSPSLCSTDVLILGYTLEAPSECEQFRALGTLRPDLKTLLLRVGDRSLYCLRDLCQTHGQIYDADMPGIRLSALTDVLAVCQSRRHLCADFAGLTSIADHNNMQHLRRPEQVSASPLANKLAHQICNPLQKLMNALYLAEHGGNDAQRFVRQASEELRSLSELVKRLLRPGDMQY
jgi:hypothetical protein